MQIILRVFDVKGYPRIDVAGTRREKGDSVRLSNWGMDRAADFRKLCEVHKAATNAVADEAQRSASWSTGRRLSFGDLWKMVLEERYGGKREGLGEGPGKEDSGTGTEGGVGKAEPQADLRRQGD